MSSTWASGLISQRGFFLSGYFLPREVGVGTLQRRLGEGVGSGRRRPFAL